jgi:hypothetical protein
MTVHLCSLIAMATTSGCPHCQQAETIHASDNIALIKAEDTRLLGLILLLQHDRSAVLQRLNTLCSATRNLPPEVLSLIFCYASPPMESLPGISVSTTKRPILIHERHIAPFAWVRLVLNGPAL